MLLLVLAAAAMHAGWNASVKSAADPLMRLVLINAGFLVCGAPLIAAVAAPARASWPMLAGSIALHQIYYVLLLNGYRAGDLSTGYPISRGSAPPITAFAVITRRERFRAALANSWRAGLGGGVMAFCGYGLVIWAMGSSPMGYVSAVREISVVLAAIIGTRMLGEPLGGRRIATAAVVAFGVVLLQLSR